MALVEVSIGEQRYKAVLAGDPVVEAAAKVGVSRQSLHTWLRRYADEGLAGPGQKRMPAARAFQEHDPG